MFIINITIWSVSVELVQVARHPLDDDDTINAASSFAAAAFRALGEVALKSRRKCRRRPSCLPTGAGLPCRPGPILRRGTLQTRRLLPVGPA